VAALGSGAVLAVGAASGVAALLTSAAPAGAAAPIVVTSLADDGTGTTLREAIEQANATAGQDTITFQTGLSGTITVASSLPKITDALDIQGPGANLVTVDGANQFALFNFYEVTSDQGFDAISGITITRGLAENDDSSGGGILSRDTTADITISNVVVTRNHATNDGGGIQFFGASGTATISGSTISNNVADAGGGGLYATGDGDLDVVITNSTFSGNTAGDRGGAIYLFDLDATISGSTITGNSADEGGGGIWAEGVDLGISFTTISGNTTSDDGGGGIKALDYSGQGGASSSTLTIRNSTISGNAAQFYGGGLYIRLAGATTIDNSTIANNTAAQAGAIYGGYGGITLNQVTISGNQATNADNGTAVGGIQVAGQQAIGSVSAQRGAGAQAKAPGERTVSRAQGGVHAAAVGTVDAKGVIVSGNSGQDVGVYRGAVTLDSDHNVVGTVDSGVTVHNLGATQTNVTNPVLGPLQNNGGATQTMALLPGSPAINAGPQTVATFAGDEFDQRGTGFARVVDGVVDVGAYEVQPPPVPESPAAAPLVITPRFTG
jgi:hypothetical protein